MYEDLQIIHYPDPRLRKISSPVTKFDDDLKALARRMFELMLSQRRRPGRAAGRRERPALRHESDRQA